MSKQQHVTCEPKKTQKWHIKSQHKYTIVIVLLIIEKQRLTHW